MLKKEIKVQSSQDKNFKNFKSSVFSFFVKLFKKEGYDKSYLDLRGLIEVQSQSNLISRPC